MNRYIIYGLQDPNDGLVKYIGKTKQPLKNRLRQHIYISSKEKTKHLKKSKWIQSLLSENKKPLIIHIETTNKSQWKEKERKWFDFYKQNLFNHEKSIGCGGDRSHFVKWDKKHIKLLGKVSDSVIAEKLGVTRKTVSYKRESLGIAASYDRTRNTPPPLMGGHNKITLSEDIINLLGKMPDAKLAKLANCSKPVINRARLARNIKSYAETTGNDGKIKKGEKHRRWKR